MHSAQCNGTLHAPWLLTLHCATIKAVSFTRSRYIEQTTVKNLPSAATFQDINPPTLNVSSAKSSVRPRRLAKRALQEGEGARLDRETDLQDPT